MPVKAQSSMSRATMTVSAADGRPGIPSRDDHAPSCMEPPPARLSVLRVPRDTEPGIDRVWSSTRRITLAFITHARVVGEDAHAERVQLPHRRELLAETTLGDAPRRRDLAQPDGLRGREHRPDDRGRRRAAGVCSASRPTPVNPPRAVARHPVSMVSASSSPGSRKVHMQVDEPRRHHTPARIEHAPSPASQATRLPDPSRDPRPSTMRTSATRSPAVSITWPHRVPQLQATGAPDPSSV